MFFEANATDFALYLSTVLPTMSRDADNPRVNCVCIKVSDGRIHLVTTDGYRMSHASLPVDERSVDGFALVSAIDVAKIASLLKTDKKNTINRISMITMSGKIHVKICDALSIFKTSNEQFPPYHTVEVLPDPNYQVKSAGFTSVGLNGVYISDAGKVAKLLNGKSAGMQVRVTGELDPVIITFGAPHVVRITIMPMRI